MLGQQLEARYRRMLEPADVRINGTRPWDIRVHDRRLYRRLLCSGTLGLGEAYMDGWWDCEQLDEFFTRTLRAELQHRTGSVFHLRNLVFSALLNLQKAARAFRVGQHHYDLDKRIFRCMLDSRMMYSCGHWKDATNLDDAQEAKLRLVFDKLMLRPGMKVLDVGCGWGGAARFAVENYDVAVTGYTVSSAQAEHARELCQGLPVTIHLQDYRQLQGSFDRGYSIGMFEHVGFKNYRTYMRVMRKALKDDGLFLLHTIGSSTSRTITDPWIAKYIFPNSMLPSLAQIGRACEGFFLVEDLQNFGADYDHTLMAWQENFRRSMDQLGDECDERFVRTWEYYLLSCAGAFRSRTNQLWQLVLSSGRRTGRYDAPR